MGTIFRNFIKTLKRFKLASALNLLGLSVAFAAFMIIMMQVRYERNFDSVYPKADRIYRLEISQDSVNYSTLLARPVVDLALEASPQIEDKVMLLPFKISTYINVTKPDGSLVGFNESVNMVYPTITELFGYEMVEGLASALNEPNKVLIPKSMAERFFGKEAAVGKMITNREEGVTYEVGGVYKDFPAHSSHVNDIKIRMPDDHQRGQWGNQNFNAYVTLYPNASPEEVAGMMTERYKAAETPDWYNTDFHFRLTPLQELYYMTDIGQDFLPKGNKAATSILFVIALLVIGIAVINFVNFSTSMAPVRIKSINTQKVLGSPTGLLRRTLVFEGIGLCVLAYCFSLLWVSLFNASGFSSLLVAPADLDANPLIVWGTLGLTIAIGLISGLYPAYYMTSFPPAMALKGSFGMSPSGRKLRTALIGFQFVISIGLIIAALFMQIQNVYLRNMDRGIAKDQIAVVKLDEDMAANHKQVLVDKLKSDPGIDDVAFAASPFGEADFYMTWGRNMPDGRYVHFTCMPVSHNFLSVMGLEIVEGRDFTEDDTFKDGTFIFNETARRQQNLELGNSMDGGEGMATVVGFVKDFNFMSLRKPIESMALYEVGKEFWYPLSVAYIKVVGDPYAAVKYIEKSIAEIDPHYPASVYFYDARFNEIYKKEVNTTKLITLFSLLAILISLVGVFGLVVFETQYRRKEIGIRKVFGSTIGEILALLNKSFVRIVAVCFVLAAPLAYCGVTSWLGNFTYRTPIHWWVFMIALVLVAAITLLIVTIQSWRVATANPVEALRNE